MGNALTYLYASLVCTYNTTHTKEFFFFLKRTCLFIVLPHLLMGLPDISVFYGSLEFIIDITLCQTSASKDSPIMQGLSSLGYLFLLLHQIFLFNFMCFHFSVSALFSELLRSSESHYLWLPSFIIFLSLPSSSSAIQVFH